MGRTYPTIVQVPASEYGTRPSPNWSVLQVEPLRTLYWLWALIDGFVFKMPFWAFVFIFRRNRQHIKYTWSQAVMCMVFRQKSRSSIPTLKFDFRTNLIGDQLATFKPHKFGTPVWIPALTEPLTGELGEMMKQTGDQHVRISGWWYGKDHQQKPAGRGKSCILWMHGGGLIEFGALPNSPTLQPMRDMLRAAIRSGKDAVPHKALAVEYRLSDNASLPGIIADVIAAWRYLIEDCGYSASDIIVSGDSAGGHLALSLTRYLVTEKAFGGALPRGLVLFSPWVDMSLSYIYAGAGKRFSKTDYLGSNDLAVASSEALRGLGPTGCLSLYASHCTLARPVQGDEFKGFPPALVHSGQLEKFSEEHKALAQQYAASGSKIDMHVTPDCPHDVYALPFGFNEQRKAHLKLTMAWMEKLGGPQFRSSL